MSPSRTWSLAFVLALLEGVVYAGPLSDAVRGHGPPLEPAPPAPPPPPNASSEMERALQAYDAQRYADALAGFERVVAGKTKDTKAQRERALFFVGKSQFNLKRFDAALTAFTGIVDLGPQNPYAGRTVQWLASIGRFISPTRTAPQVARYPDAMMDAPELEEFRDELRYHVAAHVAEGDPARARRLLTLIDPKGRYAAQAAQLARKLP